MASAKDTCSATRFDSPTQEAFLQLWRTYDCLKAFEDELFARYELSAQQYNALRVLQAAAPESMQTLALARRLISRSPDITRMLDRLQKRGLVARERKAENRRAVEVTLTSQGSALLNRMAEAVQKMHERQLGHLDTKTLNQLCALLRTARQPHESADRKPWVDG